MRSEVSFEGKLERTGCLRVRARVQVVCVREQARMKNDAEIGIKRKMEMFVWVSCFAFCFFSVEILILGPQEPFQNWRTKIGNLHASETKRKKKKRKKYNN